MSKAIPNKKMSKAQRRTVATIVGAVFVLFAAWGMISAIVYTCKSISGLFDDSADKARYESFISPVVMVDPAPFTMVENLEDELLLQSVMWAALTGENRGVYTYDDVGLLLVPASDLDVAAVKLYGPDVNIVHRSFDDKDASYLYDPEISAYRVPSISKVAYSPYVEEVTKGSDGKITLKVGYVAPGNMWSTDVTEESDTPKPEKYMLYTLAKWDQGYYVSSVSYVNPDAAPMS